mmetsp:Transcript_36063/g.70898  ORF Transcript_36063/g.70898 Transcript_36063/m.70898 type:complete len:173 (+) Transcript_36063:55-573(+)
MSSLSLENLLLDLNADSHDRISLGITRFHTQIQEAQAEPEGSKLLASYLAGSPQCSEIFSILDSAENRSYKISSLVFDLLALIVSPKTVGTNLLVARFVARKVIRHKLKNVYRILSAEDNRIVHTALRLLIALAELGSSCSVGRELASKFNFALKPFTSIPFRPFSKKSSSR